MMDEDTVTLPRKSLQRVHERNKELDARNQALEKELSEIKRALENNFKIGDE